MTPLTRDDRRKVRASHGGRALDSAYVTGVKEENRVRSVFAHTQLEAALWAFSTKGKGGDRETRVRGEEHRLLSLFFFYYTVSASLFRKQLISQRESIWLVHRSHVVRSDIAYRFIVAHIKPPSSQIVRTLSSIRLTPKQVRTVLQLRLSDLFRPLLFTTNVPNQHARFA